MAYRDRPSLLNRIFSPCFLICPVYKVKAIHVKLVMASHVRHSVSGLRLFAVSSLVLLTVTSLVASQATTSPPACRKGWKLYNGYCYGTFYRYNNYWEDIRRYCLHLDAEIASIRNADEQAFVMSYLTQMMTTTYRPVFIGLIATNGKPKWEDGRSVNYTNWQPGQPAYTNGPDCAMVNYNDGVTRGQWFVLPCYNRQHHGICKHSAACQAGWFYSNKRCYLYISSAVNWPTASNTCQQTYASQMISIGSSNEQKLIDRWLWVRAGVGHTKWFWIGLNDMKVENNLEWSDGAALTYTNWLAGHPFQANSMDCTQMFKHGGTLGTGDNGQWRLQDCYQFSLPYICEKQADISIIPVEDRGEFQIFTNLPKPKTDSSLKCTSESMSYALDKNIAPPTLYEIPYLLNDTCLPVDNGTHYIFNFDYDDCGTEIVHFKGELYYSNTINARALHTLPGMPKEPDSDTITSLVNIQLQCKFNKEVGTTTYEANYGYIVQVSQSPVFNVTGLGLFSPSMNVFTDNAFSVTVKKGSTKVYRLNQRAYFEIRITSDKRLSVRAQQCWVNVGKHDANPKAFVLQNGCPVNGNVAALTSHSSPGSNTHRLSYRVFGMRGYEDNIQFFHCTSRVCSAQDSTAFCNKGCESGARRRRQAPADTNIVEVPDKNAYFTFSTPGFFVAPSPEEDVSPTTTPKTSGGDRSGSLTTAPNILFVMMSGCLAYLLNTI